MEEQNNVTQGKKEISLTRDVKMINIYFSFLFIPLSSFHSFKNKQSGYLRSLITHPLKQEIRKRKLLISWRDKIVWTDHIELFPIIRIIILILLKNHSLILATVLRITCSADINTVRSRGVFLYHCIVSVSCDNLSTLN